MSVAVIYGHDTQKIWTGRDVVSKKNQTNKKKRMIWSELQDLKWVKTISQSDQQTLAV